jgi:hypothetical protein
VTALSELTSQFETTSERLTAEFAGALVNDRAVAFEMLGEDDA